MTLQNGKPSRSSPPGETVHRDDVLDAQANAMKALLRDEWELRSYSPGRHGGDPTFSSFECSGGCGAKKETKGPYTQFGGARVEGETLRIDEHASDCPWTILRGVVA